MTSTQSVLPTDFEPSVSAALSRLDAVNPHAYAQSRNALGGAVTRLSPYITHGFLTLQQVLQTVHARHPLALGHKFVYELGWRAYFHHVWAHEGEGIFESLHQGPLPDEVYASALPDDIRQARTGIPAIDMAVRTLYATGYLHNHARMWLASYIVHVRRVHWRAGADWLFGYLLDGDLASNHLSWQWVAGTGSHKPYLFNAENVARYAPTDWHSPATCIDASYDAMDAMARGGKLPRLASRANQADGVDEPGLSSQPPAECGFNPAQPNLAAGRHVNLIHPWSLGAGQTSGGVDASLDQDTLTVAVFPSELSARWPWSPARWRFVAQGMGAHTPHLWITDTAALKQALKSARSVRGTTNLHLPRAWAHLELSRAPTFVPAPPRRYHSFSQYWNAVIRQLDGVDALLDQARAP